MNEVLTAVGDAWANVIVAVVGVAFGFACIRFIFDLVLTNLRPGREAVRDESELL